LQDRSPRVHRGRMAPVRRADALGPQVVRRRARRRRRFSRSGGQPDLRVAGALEHAAGDTVAEHGIRLVAGSAEHMLMPRRHMTFGRNKTEYDVSSADVPPAFFAAAGDTI